MMKLSIIADDKTIVLDGEALTFDFAIDSNIHAIQWRETWGNVEYKEGAQTWFDDASLIAPFVTAFNAEKARLSELATAQATAV